MLEMPELHEQLAKLNRFPAEYEPVSNTNIRLVTETDTTVFYNHFGPNMHTRLLKALIVPKDKRFPELAVVRLAPWYFYGFQTLDGSDLPFQSLIGRFSKAEVAHQFYDAAIKRAMKEGQDDHD